MKTITDFKKRMCLGAKVSSQLFHIHNNEEILVQDLKERECVISQSNSFAMTVPGKFEDGKQVKSWCEWPKSNEFTVIDENTVQIKFAFGRLVYHFI